MQSRNKNWGQRKTAGRYSVVFGIISVFAMAPVFVPLAVIFGVVALFKRQMLLGALGLIMATIGFITSPILMSIFNLTPGAFETRSFKWEYNIPRQQTEKPMTDTRKEFI